MIVAPAAPGRKTAPCSPAIRGSRLPNLPPPRFGLSAAIVTPFDGEGRIDAGLLLAHARDLMERGVDVITLFGTTGEGPSISGAERGAALAELVARGLDPGRVIMGVLAGPPDEAVAQGRAALGAGCRGLLLAPPFYFKGVAEDGVAAWYDAVLGALGAAARDVFLYNIPQFTGVPLRPGLVARIAAAHPGVVTGIKDSEGEWSRTEALLEAHRDLMILVGAERHVPEAMWRGAAGTICGYANAIPEAMRRAVYDAEEPPEVAALEAVLSPFDPFAGMKALIAERTGEEGWLTMRPPLAPLGAEDRAALRAALAAAPLG
jgi:4-hydroxy-tetrahydrodipicolinate synthase